MTYRKPWRNDNTEYRAESLENLKRLFPQGSEVTTMIKHVTQSGMGRSIAVLAYDGERGSIVNVSYQVARVLDLRYDDSRSAVYVQGCGMDMAFSLTYDLSHVLYGTEGNYAKAGYLLNQRTI